MPETEHAITVARVTKKGVKKDALVTETKGDRCQITIAAGTEIWKVLKRAIEKDQAISIEYDDLTQYNEADNL